MSLLSDFSGEIAAIIENAGKWVVRVETGRRTPGTGILWDAQGTVITAYHNLRGDEQLKVVDGKGSEDKAELLGVDPRFDLAALKLKENAVEIPQESPGSLKEKKELKVGHMVFALGRPGKSLRSTWGIISVLGDEWRTPLGGKLHFYAETDGYLPPGFSGGPLINHEGKLIGMNTMAMPRGIGMTVPVATLDGSLETILSKGSFKRAYLGVNTHPARLGEKDASNAGQSAGLIVYEIQSGSPADKGGILLGDTLLSIEEDKIESIHGLVAALSDDRAGKKVKVTLLRAGEIKTIDVELGTRG